MDPRVDINVSFEGEPDRWVHSACILCSNGCGLEIAVKDGRIAGASVEPYAARSIGGTVMRTP